MENACIKYLPIHSGTNKGTLELTWQEMEPDLYFMTASISHILYPIILSALNCVWGLLTFVFYKQAGYVQKTTNIFQ